MFYLALFNNFLFEVFLIIIIFGLGGGLFAFYFYQKQLPLEKNSKKKIYGVLGGVAISVLVATLLLDKGLFITPERTYEDSVSRSREQLLLLSIFGAEFFILCLCLYTSYLKFDMRMRAVNIPKKILNQILEELASGDDLCRARAALALGQRGQEEEKEDILSSLAQAALKDPSAIVRYNATQSLKRLNETHKNDKEGKETKS